MEDIPGTVFYLTPFNNNKYAAAIIRDSANHSRQVRRVPNTDSDELALRIGLDQQLKSQPYLVQFGRREHNDCVVVLSPDPYRNPDGLAVERQWIFIVRNAEFRLIPRSSRGQDEATFTSASTITFNPHNTRFRTPLEPEEDDQIRSTRIRTLGSGGQGEVHKVIDMYTGAHYACKIVAVKAQVPQWRIYSERDFRARVEMEVNLVRELRHAHIVPYAHTQGFKIGRDIKIFMPIYEGNLHDLLKRLRCEVPGTVLDKTDAMLSQMLHALDFVHTRDPPIIHRDIKPPNILYSGDQFFLTDFGIAKVVDTSNTVVGTQWYMAPEVWANREQTPKVDIWGLGVTVMECLVQLLPEEERQARFSKWEQWYEYLQGCLNQHQHARPFASMLAVDIGRRPIARDLLTLQNPLTNATLGLGVSSRASQATGKTIYAAASTPMDWTGTVATAFFQGNPQPKQCNGSMEHSQSNPVAVPSPNMPPSRPAQPAASRAGSVKSVRSRDGRPQRGHKGGGSSQNGRHTLSSAGVPKRSSGRKQRPKSIRKAHEVQALGMG
ncbi:Uu.00g137150.m01.CDS01 [Anthostomella pinea]|uniref:non-specific serine/threonine protein kinase n=1 Tax=Anthostomella pinea TaxID=933095 RepID=A0AAI8YL36_9PEZI|nr:Uu.00g137150.m01.CDS01 [Anthostomella pinea]